VWGIYGPRFMRGYAGQLRWRGARALVPKSEMVGRMLRRWPRLNYGLLAVKDLEPPSRRLSGR
jgi:hypothetical protein